MIITIDGILQATQGTYVVAPADASEALVGVSWDSRSVDQGFLYVALVGERADGHAFVRSAFEKGARAALVSAACPEEALELARRQGCAVIAVADATRALWSLAAWWRDRLNATVVGITGSYGKTTTKGLLAHVLSSAYRTVATKGNFNNELGAPYTVLSANPECDMLIVEMGMDDFGQIADICSFTRPDMGLVTSVGVSHLEYLKTRENIARAKAELLCALPEGGTAFLNASGEFTDFMIGHAQLAQRGVKVRLFAGDPRPDSVYATDVRLDSQGRPRFTLHADGSSVTCALALRGLHNVDNACGVAAVALECGMSLEAIAAALATAEPEAGRQQVFHAENGAVVFNDAYNASPESMCAALRMLSSCDARGGRRIAVLGDMGELGEATVSGHEQVGRMVAACGIDRLIWVGQASGAIARCAIEGGMPAAQVDHAADAAEACALLGSMLGPDDVALVKASHFMGLDAVVKGVIGSC